MINKKSIRGRLGLLFLAFVLLVSFSGAATYWGITTQKKDALIINLSGRQRMLTQKMTWLALAQPENPELSASIELFDQTLHALRMGGETVDSSGELVILPPAPDAALLEQLDEISQTWTHFRGYLTSNDAEEILLESPIILDQLDAVVTAFEVRAEAKDLRLILIQVVFWMAAIGLLIWGFIDTRRIIINPLSELGSAVQKMGAGNLDSPIPTIENKELGELAQTFGIMRSELAEARKVLESQVLQRTRELSTAFEFSQEIVAQRDLDELLNSVVERTRLLMQAESAALCVISPNEKMLELASYSGDVDIELGAKKSIRKGFSQQVINANETVVSETHCTNCKFLLANDAGHCVATSLRAGNHTLGAICVVQSNQETPSFDVDNQRALNLLANSAAIAISNANLAKAERQKAKQAAAFAEREQLAADLHDNLAQILSFTRIKLERLDEILADDHNAEERTTLIQIEKATETAYQQVRDALTGLLKPKPERDDLAKKLASVVDGFSETYHFSVKLAISDDSVLILPPATQRQVIHIVREALSNVQRHSQAEQVWVRADRVNGHARFSIEDNGVGFDPQVSMGGDHFGLRIMRTRAERSGGEFSLSSQLGKRTQVSAIFPLEITHEMETKNTGESP
ncbi:MAG: GAF domain-containing protein [Anaerolineae bacterium]|jgi:two-component system, NarL family, nitrate/nitrite sensor histidine kinase NarX|nr:GAF domain-containing protein [Anaerolineae bacterium]MBT7189106.1 GAF domain-containing protein [Anaerolineae bacterium]MBT7783447.1 GAF domain-containing protein [Anaerolineae bacterium]